MNMPVTNLAALTDLEIERLQYAEFAQYRTAPEYRAMLAHMYAHWHYVNETFFEGKLTAPHIEIGPTHARRFSEARLANGYGGTMAICVSERIAFPENDRIIRNPWPSTGVKLLFDDLVTAETAKQSVMEAPRESADGIVETEEVYGGYGPKFAKEAERIGPLIGLPEGKVRYRRRGEVGRGHAVAASWVWAFRPEEYYLGDVSFKHLKVDGLRIAPPRNMQLAPGICGYLLFLAQTNQIERQIKVLGHLKDTETAVRFPAATPFERSPHDASGKKLAMPVLDPNWLTWNNGCISDMVKGILGRRLFDGMPILADALQDAGCEDPVLLDHCRSHTAHTAGCWALKLLSGS